MSGSRAEDLRRAFDQGFAAPPASPEETEDLLAVDLGGHAFALRVREVAELARCRRLVPLPGAVPGLLGVAGVRGEVVPVYDLAELLGQTRPAEPPGWLAICGGGDVVALGFHAFAGHLRVARSALSAPAAGEAARAAVEQVATVGGRARSIVGVDGLMKIIRGRASSRGPLEERGR